MQGPRYTMENLTPYELHKKLINHYVLNKKGATSLLQRDTSRDRTDADVIRENHKFVWEEGDKVSTWEEKLAKKYYDKLFKEYCISDLSRYRENKFAMRWQTEAEMVAGKGQFVCGAKNCIERRELKTWEVNFGYVEHGEKRNTLVKLRLCCKCSAKLNYRQKRKQVNRQSRKKLKMSTQSGAAALPQHSESSITPSSPSSCTQSDETDLWKLPADPQLELSREDEFEKYLEQLLL